MADNISIPRLVPAFETSIQADSPLVAAHETQMATSTTSLWHGSRDYHSWFWGTPTSAPVALASVSDSAFTLLGSAEFPWHYHTRAVRVHARFVIAHDAAHPISVYLKALKLLAADATPTVTGQRSERTDNIPKSGVLAGEVASGMQRYGYNAMTTLTASVVPSISGTQRILIRPMMHYHGTPGGSSSVRVHLVQMEMWNEMQRPR